MREFLCWLDAHSGAITAVATFFIFVFTLVLAVVSIYQSRLIRREFNATHRPRIIIRRVKLTFFDGNGARIDCAVVNAGESTARIIECNARDISIAGPLPAEPPYSDDPASKRDIVLKSGESYVLPINIDNATALAYRAHPNLNAMLDPKEDFVKVICLGYIRYADMNKAPTTREAAFCRIYSFETERFTKSDDPEYEYAD